VTLADERMFVINCNGSGVHLNRGRDVSFDASRLGSVLTADVTPRMADLIDIALAAYVVDRSQRRPGARQTAAGRTWGRAISVRLGVRDVDFWMERRNALSDLLHWLTDDEWNLDFASSTVAPLDIEVARRLPLPLDGAGSVALFSGGLDSLAGALIAFDSGRRPLLLSIETNSRMGATQRSLRRLLREHWPDAVSSSTLVELHGAEASEPSQRARAFLFLALAGAAATACDLEVVEVYENGIGAIGLPYLATQEGAHTTKAMHPHTLCRFAALVTSVAGRPVRYVNPSLWSTKAELCRFVAPGQRHLIPVSESCDTAFSYRGDVVYRCGTCTSCLLRRQALWAAGLEELDARQPVRTDVTALGCDAARPATGSLLAMLDQAERLDAALSEGEPWAALTSQFPDLTEVARSPIEQQACLTLYRTYVDEWRCFPSPLVDRYLARRPTPIHPLQGDCPDG
jgi:7-cyano-7-deazaguanine synthase in queuosine biosynthesis